MSNAKQDLTALVRRGLVGADAIGDPDQLDYYAESVVEALTANEVTDGWLITGKRILKVEETSLTDPGDENWAYDVYCTPPEDDDTDEETEG